MDPAALGPRNMAGVEVLNYEEIVIMGGMGAGGSRGDVMIFNTRTHNCSL